MIIGLAGQARSGKDTVADFFTEARFAPVHRLRFADDIKRFCQEVYDWTEEHTDGSLKDIPDVRYPRRCDHCDLQPPNEWPEVCEKCKGTQFTCLTPREAMQTLGSQWGRSCYPNTWVDLTLRRALEKPTEEIVLITDVRFLNEIKSVWEVGGLILQIQRPSLETSLSAHAQKHVSEVEQQSPAFQGVVTHTLVNDGTLQDLKTKALAWLSARRESEL